MYLMFYSKHCNYCSKFCKTLEKIHEEKNFSFLSVDKKNGVRNPMVAKYSITEVPSIIVDQRVYVGKEAFKWLEGKIQNINLQISSQSTRMNKTPNVIEGFSSSTSNLMFSDENFVGNSQYCSLKAEATIQTPAEGESVPESTSFKLSPDNILGGVEPGNDALEDKASMFEKKYALLKQQRNQM